MAPKGPCQACGEGPSEMDWDSMAGWAFTDQISSKNKKVWSTGFPKIFWRKNRMVVPESERVELHCVTLKFRENKNDEMKPRVHGVSHSS